MSAIRTNSNRSEARKTRSTPYARGLISRIFTYITGSPSKKSVDEDDEEMDDDSQPTFGSSPKSNFSSGNRVPLTPSTAHNSSPSAFSESSLPIPNAEQVASYFSQRMGTNVTTNELESMITDLQTSPERERFKFTFTTPNRSLSPSFSPLNMTPPASPGASPSKKLARNPNGVYRWEGGGSARSARQRNRFSSPAFGASPVKTGQPPTQQSAGQSTLPVHENKRRKVGDNESAVPFPSMPSTPRANGSLRQASPLSSSRLRTPAKPTVPVNPSPLRQAWSDVSSTSSREDIKPSQPTRPTKAASLVAELIKETAPPNKPDLSNPYQTASPVSKIGPPRRATKRPRAIGRPPPLTREQKAEEARKKAEEVKKKEEEEKLKALSAQAVIEATLPKGSKRSRPPAHLEKSGGGAPRSPSPISHTSSISKEPITHIVEEEEEEERPKKKSRSSSVESSRPKPKPIVAEPTIQEIEDVDMVQEKSKEAVNLTNGTSQSSRTTQVPSFKPSSIPREPSKLRYSFQAESSSGPSTPVSTPLSLPPPSTEVQTPPSISTAVPAPAPLFREVQTPPLFSTAVPAPALPSREVQTPPAVPAPAPPSREVQTPPSFSTAVLAPPSREVQTPLSFSSAVPAPAPPSREVQTPFLFSPAVPAPAPPSREAQRPPLFSPAVPAFAPPREVQTPSLFSPAVPAPAPPSREVRRLPLFPSTSPAFALPSREDQTPPSFSTTVPAPAPPSIQAVSNGFTFSFKSPLVTPPKEKATVHESTKPQDVDAIKAQVRAMDPRALPTFILSPAGFTAFSGTPEHINAREAVRTIHVSSLPSFTFSMTTKIFSFGFDPATPRPKSSFLVKEKAPSFKPFPPSKASTAFRSPSWPPAPKPSSDFKFTVGGKKSPVAAKDNWNCSHCGIPYPQTVPMCTFCEEHRPSSIPSVTPSSLAVVPAKPAQGFDWAAAGLKPPTSSNNTWKCGVCGLSNPKSATKCTVCDAYATV